MEVDPCEAPSHSHYSACIRTSQPLGKPPRRDGKRPQPHDFRINQDGKNFRTQVPRRLGWSNNKWEKGGMVVKKVKGGSRKEKKRNVDEGAKKY